MVLRKHKKDWQTHSQTNPKKKTENSKLVKLDMKKGDDAMDSTWNPDNDLGMCWNVNSRKQGTPEEWIVTHIWPIKTEQKRYKQLQEKLPKQCDYSSYIW